MQDYRNLETWQVAHSLALAIYKLTEEFPRTEQYGLTSQLRRSAVSIGANIAEGTARRTDSSTRYFLEIASGSAAELEYLLVLTRDLGLIQAEAHTELAGSTKSVRRLLGGFIRKLEPKKSQRPTANDH